jgi:hypothetical protein
MIGLAEALAVAEPVTLIRYTRPDVRGEPFAHLTAKGGFNAPPKVVAAHRTADEGAAPSGEGDEPVVKETGCLHRIGAIGRCQRPEQVFAISEGGQPGIGYVGAGMKGQAHGT